MRCASAITARVLAQRLGEWCGLRPELEIDLALANIGLDLLGQARNFSYAVELAGSGDEDTAFGRDVSARLCNLLAGGAAQWQLCRHPLLCQFFIDVPLAPWRCSAARVGRGIRSLPPSPPKR